MVARAAKKLNVRLEAVDSNGLLPLRATEQVFGRAFDFRRFLQKNLPAHLENFPSVAPLESAKLPKPRELPPEITKRWSPASAAILSGAEGLQDFPIDHSVPPTDNRGGSLAALRQMNNFFENKFNTTPKAATNPNSMPLAASLPIFTSATSRSTKFSPNLVRREKWQLAKVIASRQRQPRRLVEHVPRRRILSRSNRHLARSRLQLHIPSPRL